MLIFCNVFSRHNKQVDIVQFLTWQVDFFLIVIFNFLKCQVTSVLQMLHLLMIQVTSWVSIRGGTSLGEFIFLVLVHCRKYGRQHLFIFRGGLSSVLNYCFIGRLGFNFILTGNCRYQLLFMINLIFSHEQEKNSIVGISCFFFCITTLWS